MGEDVTATDEAIAWLWDGAAQAHKRTTRPERDVDGMRRRAYAQGQRDGLITALCIVTKREAEDIFESLQDGLIAQHERSQ